MIEIMIRKADKPVIIAVHGGTFHADDVIAVALAVIKFGWVIVYRPYRVDDGEYEKYDYVIDVGRKYDGKRLFDHHQYIEPYEDGVQPCGASLFAQAIFPEYFDKMYERFLRAVAVRDNGQKELMVNTSNSLFGWVRSMNPLWNSTFSADDYFKLSVTMAIPILTQVIDTIKSKDDEERILAKAQELEDGRILYMEEFAPWTDYAMTREKLLFAVHPSNRGDFVIRSVPVSEEDAYSYRRLLPIDWMYEDLRPEGCHFCHKGLMIASFDTIEHALAGAKLLLKHDL